jgi:8-oxo-dGTP diphosphatase
MDPMYQYEYPHPAVTTDIVIFTIRDARLKLLLIRRASEPFKGKWALPGGFVNIDEDLEDGARRELAEETGVSGVFLEQLEAVGWFALDELPELAFDHAQIVAMAQQRLRAKLDYSTIAFQFMPARFSLSELQRVYEIILGAEIDKRNFRKWVLALEQIEETGEQRRDGAHRPAMLYRLREPGQVRIIK